MRRLSASKSKEKHTAHRAIGPRRWIADEPQHFRVLPFALCDPERSTPRFPSAPHVEESRKEFVAVNIGGCPCVCQLRSLE